ncbi:MAG: type IV toxin-antitoxin system AbiEi family antitoxin [Proteobacteria bacterium]|nr:type IV toxin-antitoxin system AbiEi family antitoxin [Pseudomonadota bacterium]
MIGAVMGFSGYINDLLRHGKCSFTIHQAQSATSKSLKAIYSSIEHLLAKGELATPAKGFYVIVPPEYQILGCLPAEQFIPYLMEYWQSSYYVGLLTAARYHGATHQAVQVFHVMIEGRSRPQIICGKVKIRFIANRHLAETPVQTISTAKSMLRVSTPEGTAMDLLNYPQQAGGLNHIATVLTELQENIKPDKLLALAESQPNLAWKQRLGYLLEITGAPKLADVLKKYLARQKRVDYILLMPGLEESTKASRNTAWKIIENATIESDI